MKKSQLEFFPRPNILLKAKQQLDQLLTNQPTKTGITLSFGFLIASLTFTTIFYHRLPPQIPLFYSRPWGQEQLAYKIWFFILLLIYSSLLIINLRLASIFFKKTPLLSDLLVWSTAVLGFLQFITIIRIIFVVL
jgi:hypothetical protein